MDGQEVLLSNKNKKILKKKIISAGEYSTFCVEGCKCKIEVTNISFRNNDGEIPIDEESFFYNESFPGEFTIGEATHFIDIDFERCLMHMYLNEYSTITMIYFDNLDNMRLEITSTIKIIEISDNELFCDWHWAKKVTRANKHKDAGIRLIRLNKTIDAFRQFSKALKFLLTLGPEEYELMSEEDKEEVNSQKLKLYNNLAHCQLQYNEYNAVIYLCNSVLEMDNDNVKALYRRATAYMGLKDWETAYEDMNRVLALDPSVTEAKAKIIILREKVKNINEAYKKTIKSMFG